MRERDRETERERERERGRERNRERQRGREIGRERERETYQGGKQLGHHCLPPLRPLALLLPLPFARLRLGIHAPIHGRHLRCQLLGRDRQAAGLAGPRCAAAGAVESEGGVDGDGWMDGWMDEDGAAQNEPRPPACDGPRSPPGML